MKIYSRLTEIQVCQTKGEKYNDNCVEYKLDESFCSCDLEKARINIGNVKTNSFLNYIVYTIIFY